MNDSKNAPLVSIIMPAFNAALHIQESIESVQQQTYNNWELLIVDDGSTDNTADIVKNISVSDARIIYIYQSNQKLGAARNAGLKAAKGNWVAFLDSDDLWMAEKLSLQIDVASQQQVDLIFSGGYNFYHESGDLQPYEAASGAYTAEVMYQTLFINNVIPILSVLMNKNVYEKIGLQDINIEAYGCEDWDYWLRAAKSGTSFYGLTSFLFKYRIHNNGMSQNILRMQMSGFYVLVKNYDEALFDRKKILSNKLRITDLAKCIIIQLCEQKNGKDAEYYIKKSLPFKTGVEFKIAYITHSLLKKRSVPYLKSILNSRILNFYNRFFHY